MNLQVDVEVQLMEDELSNIQAKPKPAPNKEQEEEKPGLCNTNKEARASDSVGHRYTGQSQCKRRISRAEIHS